MPDVDVVVSGGGIVGLAVAHTFACHDWQTLLVDSDKAPDSQGRLGSDIRTVALSPKSLKQLHAMGLPDDTAHGTIEHMQVWEDDGTAAMSISAKDVDESRLAVVLENEKIINALEAQKRPKLELQVGTSISNIAHHSQILYLANMGEVSTRLFVIAEGSASDSLTLIGSKFETNKNLEQRAIASIVEFELPHQNRAFQKFGPTPLALLPLEKPNQMALIWSLPTGEAQQIQALDDDQFCEELLASCERKCGEIQRIDRRLSFPLNHRLVSDFNPSPWVLVIGDAAHTIHPLAGQGVNIGLEDVHGIATELQNSDSDLSANGRWRNWAAKRKLRATSIMKMMSLFTDIYAASSPLARLVRNTGVRFVSSNQAIKRQLIREAMGLGPIANIT